MGKAVRHKTIDLWVYAGVPADVAAEAGRLAAVFPLVSEVRHRLRVGIVPAAFVQMHGKTALGMCLTPPDDPAECRRTVHVVVGGFAGHELQHDDGSRWPGHLVAFADVLCHELAHYEQWRDGRALSEAGAQRRSKSLLRRLNRAVADDRAKWGRPVTPDGLQARGFRKDGTHWSVRCRHATGGCTIQAFPMVAGGWNWMVNGAAVADQPTLADVDRLLDVLMAGGQR